MIELLKGAYDLHVHAAPDTVDRKFNDIELAKKYSAIGMKGYAIKAHQFQTAVRAKIARYIVPECNVIGGITLNNAVGGINPFTVETAAQLGTQIVWFPTVDSKNQFDYLIRSGEEKPYGSANTIVKTEPIRLLDNGKLTKQVEEVLEVIKYYNLILATGHISPEESLALTSRGKETGIKKMIITHPSFKMTFANNEILNQYVKNGAIIEQCYYTAFSGNNNFETIFNQIRCVGFKNILLSTDLGQVGNPDPEKGMLDFVNKAIDMGKFSPEEVTYMIKTNPSYLVESN